MALPETDPEPQTSAPPAPGDGAAQTTQAELRATAAPGPHLLAFFDGGSRVHHIPAGRAVTIGRAHNCDIQIEVAAMSRRHFTIREGNPGQIEDLGSANGTKVNGQRLLPNRPTALEVGSLVEAGGVFFMLRDGAPTPIARPEAPRIRPPADVVVIDPAMSRIHRLVEQVARSTLPVLVLGETGVGKEIIATAVHRASLRPDKPLVKLNCAALPETLLESELFGYEKGAFTGAVTSKTGLIESAHGGTFFLDEVGEMPLSTQAKLLRVLENGEVLRIGGRKPSRVDVRFVSATNRDLRFLMGSGQFRSDLYFRLNGMAITIPPLRERAGDIQPLAEAFLVDFAARVSRPAPSLAPEALFALSTYAWPGNVRELRNVLDRSAVMCAGGALTLDVLRDAAPEVVAGDAEPPRARQPAPAPAAEPPRAPAGQAERERILDALAQANGNQKRAAEILGVSRRTLGNKLDALAIGRPRKSGR